MDLSELEFKVEKWTEPKGRVDRLLALSCNVLIARGAFDVAKAMYPGEYVTLRIGIRLIAETDYVPRISPRVSAP